MKKPLFLFLAIWLALATYAQEFRQEFGNPRRANVELLAMTNHADRNYALGEIATVQLNVLKNGLPLDGVTVKYRTGDEMLLGEWGSTVMKNGRIDFNLGTRQEPGFRALEYSFKVMGKEYKDLLKVAFAPQDIRPFTEMPNDFRKFWKKAVAEARKTPLEPQEWEVPSCTNDSLETKLVRLHVGKQKWMYGYLTRPRDGLKHPVVLCVPGAGSNKIFPSSYFSELGCIYMKVEIHDNDPRIPDNEYNEMRHEKCDGYMKRGIEDRDAYYYKDVYAGCVRCLDYLCSLADWDGKNAIVTGGSQGGALTVVTSALNEKTTALACFYPALNDLTGFLHQRAGGWPKFFTNYGDGRLSGDQEKIVKTLQYYDVVNFARVLDKPGFYSFGYNDDTCSPTSVYGMYNEITAPKILDVTPSSGHWRFPESQSKCESWLKLQMK